MLGTHCLRPRRRAICTQVFTNAARSPLLEAFFGMGRLPSPTTTRTGTERANWVPARPLRGTASRTMSRHLAVRPSLRWGDSVPLRQNAASCCNSRVTAGESLSFAATLHVNFYFHWDFSKFNI
jgi:hypothetical protein